MSKSIVNTIIETVKKSTRKIPQRPKDPYLRYASERFVKILETEPNAKYINYSSIFSEEWLKLSKTKKSLYVKEFENEYIPWNIKYGIEFRRRLKEIKNRKLQNILFRSN